MLVSTKYEEIYPPSLKNMIKVTGESTLSRTQVLEAEHRLLTRLNFEVTFPTAFRFIERIRKLVNADEYIFTLAQYLCEFCMLVPEMVTRPASLFGAASMYLAYKTVRKCSPWNAGITSACGYEEKEVRELSLQIADLLRAQESKPLKEKFSGAKYYEVAKINI